MAKAQEVPDRNLGMELVRVTEAAAMAGARWMGRGDKEQADGAAVDAMRAVLSGVSMDGIVVIGEGEKDEAPMLYNGEAIGDGHPPLVDIAVDPIDGTTLTSLGRPNAIAVIALILHSCYRLAKLGLEDGLQWLIAALCFLVTLVLQAEVALLFLAAGILGVLYYGVFRARPPTSATLSAVAMLAPHATTGTLTKLGLFFLKAGALTFGSGLVIVPFLQQGVVRQYGWLGERDFLIAVAIGMISPGPVVITATFVGYLVAGFWGALVATIGIFLPSFILVQVAAPLLAAHRANRHIQGFVKGTYGAAIGTILGACVLLGRIAIGDWLTGLIAVASLAALFRGKLSNPLLILITALVGIVAYPLLHPTWLMLK